MPFQSYSDGQILTALQLNSDNSSSLDTLTVSPQSVASTVTFGGLVTTPLTVTGLTTFSGAIVNNVTLLLSGTTYTVAALDRYIVVNKTSPAATTITLPLNPTLGRTIGVKDGHGDAFTNTITILPNPTTLTIDGRANYLLTTNWGFTTLIWAGASGWLSV